MKVFETFSGIGAQHKALEKLKEKSIIKNYEMIGTSEWYISAIIAYTLIHYNKEFYSLRKKYEKELTKEDILEELEDYTFSTDSKNPTDIKKGKNINLLLDLYTAMKLNKNLGSVLEIQSEELPNDIDVLTYSFPCQDLSNAGLKKGLEQGTRSGLLWEIGRILEGKELKDRPNMLLMENVPTLFNKFKDGWKLWKETLKKIGYKSFDVILSSDDLNSPQKRTRAFSLAIKIEKNDETFNKNVFKELENKGLEYLIKQTQTYKLYNNEKIKYIKDILDKKEKIEQKYYIKKPFNILKSTDGKSGAKFDLIDHSTYEIANRVYDINYKSPTLTTSGIIKIWEEDKKIIRNIKEIEAFQLMGFEKEDFNKVKEKFTKGHLYRFAGNSIVVNVLEGLFEVINTLLKK